MTNIEQRRLPLWLLGLFIATFALGTDEFVIAGVMQDVAQTLQIPLGQTGLLITSFALAFALGAPILSLWTDPISKKKVMLYGLLTFSLVNIFAAMSPSFTVLLIWRILAGLAAAAISSSAFVMAAAGAPSEKQGQYLSVVTAGLTVALFSGVPLGTWIAHTWDWRMTFVMIAILALLASITVQKYAPEVPGQAALPLKDKLSPLRNRAVLRLVIAIFLCGSGGLMFYSFLSPVTIMVLGQEQGQRWLPEVFLLVGLVGVVAALAGGRLADRWGGRRSRLFVIGGHAVALAAISASLYFSTPPGLFLALVCLWSFFAWSLNPPMQASTLQAAPQTPMLAVALNISGLYLGTAVAGALGGFLLERFGVIWLPVTGTVFLILAWVSSSFHDS